VSDRSRLEAAALELAAKGYHVFPCRSRGSEPLTPNGWKDATRDERRIHEWWGRRPDANIGVACGPSGICVLDIDSKFGADPEEVVSELGLEQHAFVWTGEAPEPDERHPDSLAGVRGGHVYFRGELGIVKDVYPGCEIRGQGAYVIAPPSAHHSGVPYLGNLPPVAELRAVPGPLRECAAAHAAANGGIQAPKDDERIPQGGRHEALLGWIFSRCTAKGVYDQQALDLALAHNPADL